MFVLWFRQGAGRAERLRSVLQEAVLGGPVRPGGGRTGTEPTADHSAAQAEGNDASPGVAMETVGTQMDAN